jgi:hypothetical protein
VVIHALVRSDAGGAGIIVLDNEPGRAYASPRLCVRAALCFVLGSKYQMLYHRSRLWGDGRSKLAWFGHEHQPDSPGRKGSHLDSFLWLEKGEEVVGCFCLLLAKMFLQKCPVRTKKGNNRNNRSRNNKRGGGNPGLPVSAFEEVVPGAQP